MRHLLLLPMLLLATSHAVAQTTIRGELTVTDSVYPRRGRVDVYELPVRERDSVRVTLRSRSFDGFLMLFDPATGHNLDNLGDEAWRGWTGAATVAERALANGIRYIVVAAESGGLADERGAYQVEVSSDATIDSTRIRVVNPRIVLDLIRKDTLERAAWDSTRPALQRARAHEQVAAEFRKLGWQSRSASNLLWAALAYAKETSPAARARSLQLGHELLPLARQLNDTSLILGAYDVIKDAHTVVDSMVYYSGLASDIRIARANAFLAAQPNSSVTSGTLTADDIKRPRRGYIDVFRFDGKRGQQISIDQNTNLRGYTVLISPAGDTLHRDNVTTAMEHELGEDGEWLIAVVGVDEDSGSYRLKTFFQNSTTPPELTPLPRARAEAFVNARAAETHAGSLGPVPNAAPFYERASQLYGQADRPIQAALMLAVHGILRVSEDKLGARDRLHEALLLAQRAKHEPAIAYSESFLGTAYSALGQTDSAFIYYERAVKRFNAAGLKEAEQQARDRIAALRTTIAARSVDGALSGQLANDDITWAATARVFDAWTFHARAGDSLSVSLINNEFDGRLRLLSPLGPDTSANAIRDQTTTVGIRSDETGWWMIIVESAGRGRYGLRVSNGKNSLTDEVRPVEPAQQRHYARAVALRDSAAAAGETSAAAELYKRAGDAFNDAGRNREAFVSFFQGVRVFGAVNRPDDARNTLASAGATVWYDSTFNVGRVLYNFATGVDHVQRGEYGYAINALKNTFADYVGLQQFDIWNDVNYQIANAHAALGQYEQGLQYYSRAKLGYFNKDAIKLGNATHGIAVMQLELGRYDEALKNFSEALASFRSQKQRASEGVALRSLGAVHSRKQRPDSAIAYYRQALAIQRDLGNRNEIGALFNALGRAFVDQNQRDSALTYHSEALRIYRQLDNAMGVGRALHGAARAYARGNADLPRAAAYFDSASVAFSVVREKAGLESERISIADQFASLSQDWMRASLGRADALGVEASQLTALAVVERGRAQALIDLMRNVRERDLQPGADLAAEGQQITNALQTRRTASLSYLSTADTLYVFLTTPSGQLSLHRTAIADTTLTRQVTELRRALDVDSAAVRSAGDELERNEGPGVRARVGATAGYAAVLQRLAANVLPRELLDKIPQNVDVVVVPHGSLSLLPFAALPVGTQPFGTRNRVRYAPSLTALLESEARPSNSGALRNALVVGNPEMPEVFTADFQKRKLTTLPGAESEGRAIAQRLNAPFVTGTAATEPQIVERMKSAPLVHLATHGFAYGSDQRSRDSFIALAPEGKEDGLLTVGEVLSDPDLKLVAELVVLSACQTGLGSRKVAEGTVGLQWAFLAKGARTVLVSLWSVSDAVTRQFMESFYKHWTAGGTKAEALQKAQEEVRKTHPNPRYWAAFQLVGAN